jgi:hypothetical protein
LGIASFREACETAFRHLFEGFINGLTVFRYWKGREDV